MTRESAEKFIKKMKTDESFFESMQNAEPSERAKIIAGAGFNFTGDEIKKVLDEVSDEELMSVAGGQWKSGNNEMRAPEKPNEAGELRSALLKPEFCNSPM